MSSAGASWTCKISLRYDGETRRFGPEITNKSEVELWLRRAQGAILSTDTNKAPWKSKSADEIRQAIQAETGMLKFTENTIVVDIQDPGATDLSFVDLPGTDKCSPALSGVLYNVALGLIQNSDEHSIELIRSLVRRHVAGENTLILVTIPVSGV